MPRRTIFSGFVGPVTRIKEGVMGSAHHFKREAKKAARAARKRGLSAEVVEQKQVRFRWRVETKRKE